MVVERSMIAEIILLIYIILAIIYAIYVSIWWWKEG